jgi:hypothetical protein
VRTAAADRPLSVQLYGGDVHTIAEAARWLVDRGCEGIDLNMGCPMAKLNRPALVPAAIASDRPRGLRPPITGSSSR